MLFCHCFERLLQYHQPLKMGKFLNSTRYLREYYLRESLNYMSISIVLLLHFHFVLPPSNKGNNYDLLPRVYEKAICLSKFLWNIINTIAQSKLTDAT